MGSLIPLGFWAASGAGASVAGSYELISTTVLGADTASVTFSGLGTSAAAYKHLQIRFAARSAVASAEDGLALRFNGDSSNTYAQHILEGRGASVGSYNGVPRTSVNITALIGNTSTANSFSGGVIDILDFSSTVKNKTVRSLAGSTGNNYIGLLSGLWPQTSAVTSVTLTAGSANLLTGSRFSLYGLRG